MSLSLQASADGTKALVLIGATIVAEIPLAGAAQFDDSKNLATTSFVKRALGNKRGNSLVYAATTTLDGPTVAGLYAQLSGAGPYTITLPLASSVGAGAGFGVIVTGSGTITIQRQGTDQIYSALNSPVTSITVTAGDVIWFQRDGGTVWNITEGSKLLAVAPQFSKLAATNGYQKLPGGIIIQWGSLVRSATSVAVTFPIAFPSACFLVNCTQSGAVIGDVTSGDADVGAYGVSTTGFTMGTDAAPGGTATAVWIAIGN
jgi:hypothetical protein